MKRDAWEEFEQSLTIVGDQAYLPDEHAPIYPMPKPWNEMTREERREYRREWMRRRRDDPEYRARERERARSRRRQMGIRFLSDERLAWAIRVTEERLARLIGERRRRERSQSRREDAA